MATNPDRLTPAEVAAAQQYIIDNNIPSPEQPTWRKPCDRCGHEIARWRGMSDVSCGHCDAQYNAGGQRLRDDWRGNPSTWDEDISDLEGYEIQHADDQ